CVGGGPACRRWVLPPRFRRDDQGRAGQRAAMKQRAFGKHGISVSEIGFGAWAIGGSWGPQAEEDSVAALNRALDLGVTLIDTAAGYGNGRSERTIAR